MTIEAEGSAVVIRLSLAEAGTIILDHGEAELVVPGVDTIGALEDLRAARRVASGVVS